MAHCNGDICVPSSLWGDWKRARVCGCECETCLIGNHGMGVLRGEYVKLPLDEPRVGGTGERERPAVERIGRRPIVMSVCMVLISVMVFMMIGVSECTPTAMPKHPSTAAVP